MLKPTSAHIDVFQGINLFPRPIELWRWETRRRREGVGHEGAKVRNKWDMRSNMTTTQRLAIFLPYEYLKNLHMYGTSLQPLKLVLFGKSG